MRERESSEVLAKLLWTGERCKGMDLYGCAKVLDVDLSRGEIIKRDLDPKFVQVYIGGMGFSCKILYDEVGADVEPLSADNVLIFANGTLTGTTAPSSGRTEITTKSPLTGNIGTGNTGGDWGVQLRRAGFDVLVIRNRAKKPVYLWISDNAVEVKEAYHLWGMSTVEASDFLRREIEPSPASKVSVLAIGPAGEHLVRYACPINDYHHVAARGGIGAVMGSKNLKAIAVRGTGILKPARPREFEQAVKEARERILAADTAIKTFRDRDELKYLVGRGCLRAKNFQTGVLPQFLETRGRDVALKYITKNQGTCHSCPTSCFHLVEVREGKYAGVKVSRGAAPGVVSDWGAKCAIDNLPAIWKCKELCQQLGMDYASASGSIAFAMELFQRGIITTKDTDGIELNWGNEDAVVQMLHNIAFRNGFGDVLAEGSVRAATRIGKGAEQYVMTIKGMEMMSIDPRSGPKGWVFGDITNPRGGDNVKSTHIAIDPDRFNPHWWIEEFDMFSDVKEKIYSMPSKEVSATWEGKAMMCKWFEDLYSIFNALGLCFTRSGARLALGPTYLSKLYSAYTGRDTTPQDMMKLGERMFTLLKAHTMRQGLARKDDNWPDRFYEEPLPEGPAKGAVLSRETIAQLLDEYYELRGWDKRSGAPTEEKLIELGLHDVAKEMGNLGRFP